MFIKKLIIDKKLKKEKKKKKKRKLLQYQYKIPRRRKFPVEELEPQTYTPFMLKCEQFVQTL